MVSLIRNVAFDCSDPYALAGFWSEVVGRPIEPDAEPGDAEVHIDGEGEPRLYFQAVPEGKVVKNRMHVCLEPGDRDRDAEAERLIALGATMFADHRNPD